MLTCSGRFLRYNKLEQLEFKLEKIIGIQKHAGKVRKLYVFHLPIFQCFYWSPVQWVLGTDCLCWQESSKNTGKLAKNRISYIQILKIMVGVCFFGRKNFWRSKFCIIKITFTLQFPPICYKDFAYDCYIFMWDSNKNPTFLQQFYLKTNKIFFP